MGSKVNKMDCIKGWYDSQSQLGTFAVCLDYLKDRPSPMAAEKVSSAAHELTIGRVVSRVSSGRV